MDTAQQETAEQQTRVDALAALAAPVDILQVQPQSELVERQRGSQSVQQCHERRRAARGLSDAEAGLRQPHVANDQEDQHTPNEMMNMDTPDDDVTKRPSLGVNRVRDAAEDAKRQQEG